MEIYAVEDFDINKDIVIILVEDLYKYLGNLASMVNLNYFLIFSLLSGFVMVECCLKSNKKKYLLINNSIDDKIIV